MKCKCGNEDLTKMMVIATNNKYKLVCGLCGKYIKFLNKEELNIMKFNDVKIIKE